MFSFISFILHIIFVLGLYLSRYRAIGSFFMIGVLSKNVSHHDWPATKINKKHWLKRFKAVPHKTKFEPEYK